MASDALIQFHFAGLPPSYCFTTPSRFASDIVAQMSGFVPGEYSVIIDSETEPDAADRGKLWHKLLPGRAPSGKIYKYYLGKWVSPNPVEPNADERRWWVGTEAQAWEYDGGDPTDPSATPPTQTTGAMWERDTDFDFKFPLAKGTSPASTTVDVGDTGGNEEITLSLEQIPAHSHSLNDTGTNRFARYNESSGNQNPWGSGNSDSFEGEFTFSTRTAGGKSDGTTDVTNIMPPYRVGMWIKRTSRVYYVA